MYLIVYIYRVQRIFWEENDDFGLLHKTVFTQKQFEDYLEEAFIFAHNQLFNAEEEYSYGTEEFYSIVKRYMCTNFGFEELTYQGFVSFWASGQLFSNNFFADVTPSESFSKRIYSKIETYQSKDRVTTEEVITNDFANQLGNISDEV